MKHVRDKEPVRRNDVTAVLSGIPYCMFPEIDRKEAFYNVYISS